MAIILETYKAQAETEKVAARQEITETLSRNIELERLLEISRAETADRDATIVELQVRQQGLGCICDQTPRPRFLNADRCRLNSSNHESENPNAFTLCHGVLNLGTESLRPESWNPATQTEIARLRAEEAALRAEIGKLTAERDEAWRDIKTLRAEVAALEKTVAGLKEDAQRRQKENEEAFTRNSLLNKELEATKKVNFRDWFSHCFSDRKLLLPTQAFINPRMISLTHTRY